MLTEVIKVRHVCNVYYKIRERCAHWRWDVGDVEFHRIPGRQASCTTSDLRLLENCAPVSRYTFFTTHARMGLGFLDRTRSLDEGNSGENLDLCGSMSPC